MPDFLVSVTAGLFGVAGAGLVSWALGALFWRPGGASFPSAANSLLVLIPAHDEEATLPATVRGIREAGSSAGRPVRIVVGADACTDRTEKVAAEAGAEVISCANRSKWKTLSLLAANARAGEWVALVDAGAVWPRELLSDMSSLLTDGRVMGVAPAYFPRAASRLERSLWSIEASWKSWENYAGGPMSAHGATVLFRGEVLAEALAYLSRRGGDNWLTDDVALPLAARIRFPKARFQYWKPADPGRRVSDLGLQESKPQFARRSRMAAGNAQWIRSLWPSALRHCPAAGLLAVRRIFRMFWAYWCFLILHGFCLLLSRRDGDALMAAIVIMVGGACFLAAKGRRGIVDAAVASFAAPLFLAFSRSRRRWS
ncbi:MAG TPA: glycosyltransferase [Bdellovibrionota bacterium]|jgi:glycosyltransferase involved in cell wall biosynthesis